MGSPQNPRRYQGDKELLFRKPRIAKPTLRDRGDFDDEPLCTIRNKYTQHLYASSRPSRPCFASGPGIVQIRQGYLRIACGVDHKIALCKIRNARRSAVLRVESFTLGTALIRARRIDISSVTRPAAIYMMSSPLCSPVDHQRPAIKCGQQRICRREHRRAEPAR